MNENDPNVDSGKHITVKNWAPYGTTASIDKDDMKLIREYIRVVLPTKLSSDTLANTEELKVITQTWAGTDDADVQNHVSKKLIRMRKANVSEDPEENRKAKYTFPCLSRIRVHNKQVAEAAAEADAVKRAARSKSQAKRISTQKQLPFPTEYEHEPGSKLVIEEVLLGHQVGTPININLAKDCRILALRVTTSLFITVARDAAAAPVPRTFRVLNEGSHWHKGTKLQYHVSAAGVERYLHLFEEVR